ncbi:STAS domain-containing protein [Saccharopolyspora sp. CA-218241]|uniref:STAS domain-containing protein n=1 Tax=Saccharopolyspora sp. CA-218241 TaxID=3240027 RepID=UPI003D96848B
MTAQHPAPEVDAAGRTAPARTPGAKRLRVAVPRADALVVTVDGEIDATTTDELDTALWPLLDATVEVIVLDLTGVRSMDVPGIQLVTRSYMHTQDHGIALRVVVADDATRRALADAGVDVLLECHPTVGAALGITPGSGIATAPEQRRPAAMS